MGSTLTRPAQPQERPWAAPFQSRRTGRESLDSGADLLLEGRADDVTHLRSRTECH